MNPGNVAMDFGDVSVNPGDVAVQPRDVAAHGMEAWKDDGGEGEGGADESEPRGIQPGRKCLICLGRARNIVICPTTLRYGSVRRDSHTGASLVAHSLRDRAGGLVGILPPAPVVPRAR